MNYSSFWILHLKLPWKRCSELGRAVFHHRPLFDPTMERNLHEKLKAAVQPWLVLTFCGLRHRGGLLC